MPGALLVDDFDLRTIGVEIESTRGWFSGIELRHESVPTPGRIGNRRLSNRGLWQPRQIPLIGTQKGATLAELFTFNDELKRRVGGGKDVQLRWTSRPDRYITAYLQNPGSLEIPPAFAQRIHQLQLLFLAEDPRFHDVAETVLTYTVAPAAIATGTAVSYPTLEVTGAVSGLVLTQKNAAAEILAQMSFPALALAAGSVLSIDTANKIITIDGVNAADYLSEDSTWIEFWPDSDGGTIEAAPAPALARALHHLAWE